MIILDLLSQGPEIFSPWVSDLNQQKLLLSRVRVLEEIFKTVAEGFFLIAIYDCWQTARKIDQTTQLKPSTYPVR